MPIPYTDSFQSYLVNPQASPLGFPASVSISGSWSTATGNSVSLEILASNGSAAYRADASSGSFSLSFAGEPYTIEAYSVLPETVTVTGTSWSPIVNVGVP